jgi:hypothetical protein
MKKMNKTHHLTILSSGKSPLSSYPLNLVLTPPNQRGYCHKCKIEKEILVRSEKLLDLEWEIKKFCWPCSLSNLVELENSDIEFENKPQIIKQIRESLLKDPSGEELLECYG